MKKKLFIWSLALTVAFTMGTITKTSDNYFEISKNLDIFGKLYREINTLYVDGVDPTKSMNNAITAMLGQLDPYTNFISESEIEDYKFMSTGQYGGIGANVEKRQGKFIVTEPYQDYPASKAGLLAGDILLKIDEEPVRGKNLKEVRDLLRGEKGTKVRLSVQRGTGTPPMVVALERDRIQVNNVPYFGMARNDIAYISLTGFTQGAAGEVRAAFEGLKAKNPGLKGVILDLRGNPGGILGESVNISNIWVNQGEKIVETRGKDPSSNRSHFARNAPSDTKIPIAVLVNGSSASASEIVSGSLQDLDRAVIIGSQSFGKGLVQNIRPLSYNTQLKVTIAKYYTPSGRCIQAIDYTNRKDDGSVGKVPDSLKTAFQTKGGRTVYDGGGIEPDIPVEKPALHTLTRQLQRRGLIFDYVTKFAADKESIAGPREFEVTDAVYNDFVAFVGQQDFSYKTKAEKKLAELKDALEEEAYESDVSGAFSGLTKRLSESKDSDLRRHQEEIARLLRREIVQRYHFKEGVIEASFDDDEDIAAAVEVLRDKTRYQSILSEK